MPTRSGLALHYCLLSALLCLSSFAIPSAYAGNGLKAAPSGMSHFVVAVHEWPPFSSQQAKYFGIAPRLATELLQNEGMEVKYRFIPWSGALDGVITGEFDGAIVWVTDDLQRDTFLVSDALFEQHGALYYRKNMAAPASAEDLIGRRLGVHPAYIYDLAIYRQLKNQGITSVEANSEAAQLQNLLEGKIDFYLYPMLTETPTLHKSLGADAQNALTYSTNLFKFPSPHLVINRHRQGSAEFMNKFNLRLNRMKAAGTVERYINDLRLSAY